MSSTNRGAARSPLDDYQTPPWCVDALLPFVDFRRPCIFVEPCRGAGNIYDRVPTQKTWAEISPNYSYTAEGHQRDYLTCRYEAELIITNPPFSLGMDFLRKSLDEASTVVCLMRLNMLGSRERRDFWNGNRPTHLFPLTPRPSFTNGGTDSCEYAWFAWDRGNRIKTVEWLTVLTKGG